ncbi:MAG: helix-turn-helix domain-containing protein [Actinomycetota bacterium]
MAYPSKYKEHYPELVKWMARQGLTNVEIADELGVSRETIRKWRKQFPDFDASLQEGKDIADARVEESLYQRAIGFSYEEREVQSDPETRKPVKVKTTYKHMVPDVTACIFWLKNRRPKRWRDVSRIEAEITDDRTKEAGKQIAENEEARELVKQAFRVIHGGGDAGGQQADS